MWQGAREEQSKCFWLPRKMSSVSTSCKKSTKWEVEGAPRFPWGHYVVSFFYAFTADAVLQGRTGEGRLITFRKRHKLWKRKKLRRPQRKESCELWNSSAHFSLPWSPACLLASTHSSDHPLVPPFSPLPGPFLSSPSPGFPHPLLTLTSSCISFLLFFLITPHLYHSPLLKRENCAKHWPGNWWSWVTGIQRVALSPQVTSSRGASRGRGWTSAHLPTCLGNSSCSQFLWTNWAQITQALKCYLVCVHSQSTVQLLLHFLD